ncbi:MAG TPA: hypothetical protein VGB14_18495, partial [Acidimicrobiales bacterium]
TAGPLAVDTGTTTVETAAATAHLRRSYTSAVGVYEGAATVTTAGRELAVPALREAQVWAPGRLPARPRPMRYDPDDPWDRHFLGRAIAFGEELQARASTYTASLAPGEGRTAGFYQLLLPQLEDEPAFEADLLDEWRTPGETLVGAAIAALGERGGFTERWGDVFGFRDEGAAWGLVALDQGVDSDPLRATIEQALNLSTAEFGAPADFASRPVLLGAGLDGAGPGAGGGPGSTAPGAGGTRPTGSGPDGLGPGFNGPGATDPAGTGPLGSFPGGPGPGETVPGGGPLPTVTFTVPPVPTVPGGGGDDDGGPIDDIVDDLTTLPPLPTTLPPLPTTLPPIPTTRPTLPPTTIPPLPTTRPTLPPTTIPPLPTTRPTVPPLPTTTSITLPPFP